MPNTAKNFFTQQEQDDIKQAILNAELDTSGEIRIHIQKKCKGDILDCAADIFKTLGMDKTQAKNGVLIYVAVENRSFAIIGDSGINAVVPADFWESTKSLIINHFREGRFAEGLITGIAKAGEQLKLHFPYHKDDVNELTDDISFENN
jgi:uncharacterized membrane protein